jgi:hypothetical protein
MTSKAVAGTRRTERSELRANWRIFSAPLRLLCCSNSPVVAQNGQLAPEPLAVEECAAQDDHALAVDGRPLQEKPADIMLVSVTPLSA